MVAWWQGENNANDSAGGFNGAANAGITSTPGEVGQALAFDGATGLITIGNIQGTNLDFLAGDFTVMFWINTSQAVTGGIGGFLIGNGEIGQAPGFRVVLQPPHIRFRVADAVNADVVDTGAVNDGTWHFVAFTRQGLTLTSYVDGVLINTTVGATAPSVDTAQPFVMGSRSIGDSFYLGALDETVAFNRALALVEIQDVFNAGSNGICK